MKAPPKRVMVDLSFKNSELPAPTPEKFIDLHEFAYSCRNIHVMYRDDYAVELVADSKLDGSDDGPGT